MSQFSLYELEKIIEEQSRKSPKESWTASLVKGEKNKAAQKFGEETIETLIAFISGNQDDLVHETADLLYHLLVMLNIAHLPLKKVLYELEKRTAQSGISEKLNRIKTS